MDNLLTIKRIYQDDCTVGIMQFNEHRFFSLELPSLCNLRNVSCIPEGLYRCRKVNSNKFGECIEIRDVIDRTLIRIHWANFTRDIKGCIAVGNGFTDIDRDGVIDVPNSKATFKKLMSVLPDEFKLKIH
jgi:hypothetical protein